MPRQGLGVRHSNRVPVAVFLHCALRHAALTASPSDPPLTIPEAQKPNATSSLSTNKVCMIPFLV